MSVNSSSTSTYGPSAPCGDIRVNFYMYITIYALRTILLVPLSTFVLYLGHQRWRQHRSSKPATHSDIFTYNVAVMELIGVLGILCLIGGKYTNQAVPIEVGMDASLVPVTGEIFFHILTCVERYLAVVHPITYMGLKNARGAKIRNICIGCVWLLSFGKNFATMNFPNYSTILMLCINVFFVLVISLCSLLVLCVLIRPGPGEEGGKKQRIDQSKQRAFYTITVISVTVWLWFVGVLVSSAVDTSPQLNESVLCLVNSSVLWLNLPSSLVSPLLYLHRAGKLSWCCRNNE